MSENDIEAWDGLIGQLLRNEISWDEKFTNEIYGAMVSGLSLNLVAQLLHHDCPDIRHSIGWIFSEFNPSQNKKVCDIIANMFSHNDGKIRFYAICHVNEFLAQDHVINVNHVLLSLYDDEENRDLIVDFLSQWPAEIMSIAADTNVHEENVSAALRYIACTNEKHSQEYSQKISNGDRFWSAIGFIAALRITESTLDPIRVAVKSSDLVISGMAKEILSRHDSV